VDCPFEFQRSPQENEENLSENMNENSENEPVSNILRKIVSQNES
jgi:hypothetical protein